MQNEITNQLPIYFEYAHQYINTDLRCDMIALFALQNT